MAHGKQHHLATYNALTRFCSFREQQKTMKNSKKLTDSMIANRSTKKKGIPTDEIHQRVLISRLPKPE